ANERTTFTEAFAMADDVLYQGVKGVTDLMVKPGLINLDFADVRAVMDEMGKAMMGTGEAEGEERAVQASEKAIANPLLDEISLKGARGVLINITGGYDLTLFELDEAANRIREEVDPDANIIVGSTLDPDMEGFMRVSVVATGIDAVDVNQEMPVPRRRMAEPLKPATRTAADTGAEQPAAAPRTRTPEPVVAETEPLPDEPELFDATRAAADEQLENVFPAEAAGQDDLPPPAYQGRPEGEAGDDRVAQFTSPRASAAPGTPTDEALARLQAAVQRQPGPQAREEHPAEVRGETDRPRFGINSLINRMTGHGGQDHRAQAEPAERAQPPVRARVEARVEDEPEIDMEIPAFLRRQAN
ncbi:MAG TPA: cell division protein FtsZ, partial [Aliiroseovarius sp.]|nr:cell division protein FtsZ [Aliiroseovarius sp.]